MTLVYIGCGIDFELISKFSFINKFIYIDSQPKSEFGYIEYDTGYFYRSAYMVLFRNTINKSFVKINLVNTYPDVYFNFSSEQTLYHYYNLPFPLKTRIYQYGITKDDINKLKTLLSTTTHLQITGFNPNTSILKYFTNKITLVTNYNTFYPKNISQIDELYDKNKITTDLLLNKNNICDKINKIIYYNKDNNLINFDNYPQFLLNI